MKSRFLSIAVLLCSAIGLSLSGCGKTTEEIEETARPVKTHVAEAAGSMLKTYPGRVRGSQRVKLSFRVSGPLTDIKVEEGELVAEGQMLAHIDPRDFKVAAERAAADFEKAEADYRRYAELYAENAVALAEFQLYRARRDVAGTALEHAKNALEDTELKAPFAGVIGEKFVDSYQVVRAQQNVMSLNDISEIEIVIDVPEKIVATSRRADVLKFFARFDVAPEKEYPLEVKEISTSADPATQTYRVSLTMPQPEEINVLPGMSATVKQILITGENEKPKITVPASAVFSGYDGKTYVWVVNPMDLTVNKREVAAGSVTGEDSMQILRGLEPGERIAVTAVHMLKEGDEIRLMGDDR